MLCIFSLPGESARRDRVVTRPYSTAHAAQTRATTIPWFVRKLLNRNPPRSDWRAARGSVARTFDGRIAQHERYPVQTRAQSIVLAGWVLASVRVDGCALPSRHPQASARLGRSGTRRALLLRLRWLLSRGGLGPAGLAGGALSRRARRRARLDLTRIGHLQPRERVTQRPELLWDRALQDVQQRPDGVDRVACLLQVALGRRAGIALVSCRRQAPSKIGR